MADKRLRKTAVIEGGYGIPIQVLNPLEAEKHYTLHTYKPSCELAFFVHSYWVMEWYLQDQESFSCQIISSPFVTITFTEYGAQITGVTKGLYEYDVFGKGKIFGVMFRPGGFYPFYKNPISALTNAIVPAKNVFGEMDSSYNASILHAPNNETGVQSIKQLLVARLPVRDKNIELINDIIYAAESSPTPNVGHLANAFNLSERRLQELFNTYVGVGLKWIILRNKLQQATQLALKESNPKWADIAIQLGYTDQPHFISDFKRIIGKTPAQYASGLLRQKIKGYG